MSTISLSYSFTNNTLADATEVNSNFSTIVNDYNGSITNANISGSAAINESKILFSTSGHGHGGGTDGQQIRLSSFVGSFERDTSTASGTQSVTGVGFTPTTIIFLSSNGNGTQDAASWGFDDGTRRQVLETPNDADTTTLYEGLLATRSISFVDTSANRYSGIISTFDADGFTVSWTKTGTPTATLAVRYLALAVTSG